MSKQTAPLLFRLDCVIYLEDSLNRIHTPCGEHQVAFLVMKPLTELGHLFCRGCIEAVIQSDRHYPMCLTCRRELLNNITQLRSFRTVLCRDAYEETG
jgi:hypothetical protein